MKIDRNNFPVSLTNDFYAGAGSPVRIKKASPRITLRLADEEREILRKRAGRLSVSAYIRQCLFGKDTTLRKTRNPDAVKDSHALARLLGLMGKTRIADNLESLAREARSGAILLDDVTLRQIDEACRLVRAMRDQLVAALGLIESKKE